MELKILKLIYYFRELKDRIDSILKDFKMLMGKVVFIMLLYIVNSFCIALF
jgi:hypothetical protein